MSKVNPNLRDNLTSEEYDLLPKYKSDSTIKSLLKEYNKIDEDMEKFNENGEYSKLEKCDREQGGIGRKIAKRLSELTSGSSRALKKGSKKRSSKRGVSKRRSSKKRSSKRRVSKRTRRKHFGGSPPPSWVSPFKLELDANPYPPIKIRRGSTGTPLLSLPEQIAMAKREAEERAKAEERAEAEESLRYQLILLPVKILKKKAREVRVSEEEIKQAVDKNDGGRNLTELIVKATLALARPEAESAIDGSVRKQFNKEDIEVIYNRDATPPNSVIVEKSTNKVYVREGNPDELEIIMAREGDSITVDVISFQQGE